jgi:DtxR family Mn-dependent transcriptional regulator
VDTILIIIAAIIAFGSGVIFTPRFGLLPRLRTAKERSERILIEDALKHIYDCEYKERICTINSIAGALQVSQNATADLLRRMQDGNLITLKADTAQLTPNGKEYALRIIRSHRLWERFLADETNIRETEWHSAAERMEHSLSDEAVNQLAARLGHPMFDPHGDPIPTELGNQPATDSVPLTELAPGASAVIVHIEDEPETTYAELVKYGFTPGQQVEVIDATSDSIVVDRSGLNVALPRIAAANLTVSTAVAAAAPEPPVQATLADVPLGGTAIVKRILPACRGKQRRRLMDLGVLPGTLVRAEMISPMGDPIAYRIRGASIALRRDQATMIEIEPSEVNAQ